MDNRAPFWSEVIIRVIRSSVPFALGAWGFQSQINASSDRPYFLIACVFLMGLLPADIATALAKRWGANGNGGGGGTK